MTWRANGKMPPWKPHPAARGLSRRVPALHGRIEISSDWAGFNRLQAWRSCRSSPLPPQFTRRLQLGQPDLVLTTSEPFTIPAAGPDIYRSFCLPFPLDRDVTVRGVEFRPGNRRVVHHSRTYLDDTGDARRRDHDDREPGFTGWFGTDGRFELPYPGLGAWTPGMTPRFAPEGSAG